MSNQDGRWQRPFVRNRAVICSRAIKRVARVENSLGCAPLVPLTWTRLRHVLKISRNETRARVQQSLQISDYIADRFHRRSLEGLLRDLLNVPPHGQIALQILPFPLGVDRTSHCLLVRKQSCQWCIFQLSLLPLGIFGRSPQKILLYTIFETPPLFSENLLFCHILSSSYSPRI